MSIQNRAKFFYPKRISHLWWRLICVLPLSVTGGENWLADDGSCGRHYTSRVSRRAKLVLLCVVIAAILYVLISPLPELAATTALKFPAPAFTLFVILLLGSLIHTLLLAGPSHENFFCSLGILLARNCVWLC